MTKLQKIIYRSKVRKSLENQPIELLEITLQEVKKALENIKKRK
ncbi:MAG: hypothetical protein SO148_06795 [Candidatus Onthovivens sp.]|nr:hypothetical protein [Candidatus Onthovivens sp.]